MKNRILQTAIIIFSLLATIRCGELVDISPSQNLIQREFTTPHKDPVLQAYKEKLSSQTTSGRVASTISERIDWNKSYRIIDNQKDRTAYTIPLFINEPNQFDNLVIVNTHGKEEAYVIRYKPNKEYLVDRQGKVDFKNFTGTIQIVELNNDVRVSTTFENGKAKPGGISSSNSRVNDCESWIEVEWTEVYALGNTYITEMTITEHIFCYDSGSGSGGGAETGIPSGSGGSLAGYGNVGALNPPTTDDCTEDYCIQNQLTTPCLKNTADKVLNPNLTSTYNNLIQDIFNQSDEVNLIVVEGTVEGGYGSTGNAISNGEIVNVIITLNTNELVGASQEYVASTILHECFHAIINYLSNNGYSSDHQHLVLFTDKLNLIATGLQAAFPNMQLSDARALILRGALALEENGTWSSSFVTDILNSSGYSRSQVEIVREKYKNLISGTPCN